MYCLYNLLLSFNNLIYFCLSIISYRSPKEGPYHQQLLVCLEQNLWNISQNFIKQFNLVVYTNIWEGFFPVKIGDSIIYGCVIRFPIIPCAPRVRR